MNSFSDWSKITIEPIKTVEMIEQRLRENNRVIERMEIDTKVFISHTGMHDKLHPRYAGPFTIVEVTEKGNYFVENCLKQRLHNAFPIQRIKVVEENENMEETVYEVEKILAHKLLDNGHYLYQVKWKNLPKSETSWEPSENFMDQHIISNYWKQKERPTRKKW